MLGAASAKAAPAATGDDIALTLNPTSGNDFTADHATLSWTVPNACVGNGNVSVDAFLYQGTGPWDTAAINVAEGNSGASNVYSNFSDVTHNAATTGSASWPNVPAPGYNSFTGGVNYANTAALVAAKGPGLYTLAVACIDGTSFHPLMDASNNPIAGSQIIRLGTTGNNWGIVNAAATHLALSGTGTASLNATGTVALTAMLTASDQTTPVGGVNFYAGDSATGTPLNGANPVAVDASGKAQFNGASGYGPGIVGGQDYTAAFTPTDATAYTPTTTSGPVNLIFENVNIVVTATQDPAHATSIRLSATATGTPTALGQLPSHVTVGFVIDGKVPDAASPDWLTLNAAGVATATKTGIALGAHTITAHLANSSGDPTGATGGYAVTANTVQLTTSAPTSSTAVSLANSSAGLQVTAAVTGPAGSTASPTGTVTFKDGATSLGTGTLHASGAGKATTAVSVFSLTAGPHTFTATYGGSASMGGSTGTDQFTEPVTVTWVHPGTPAISGTAAVGSKLTAAPGTWSPSGVHLAFQWLASGTPITGATGTTLVLGTAQSGKTISVQVTGYLAGDVTSQATSKATAAVGKALTSATPKITGTAKVGSTLKVSTGTWTSGTTFTFQWLANGQAISGAKGSSLKLSSSVLGKRISVSVTGSKAGFTSKTVTSAQTAAVTK
jgi:hypothetical protein